MPTATSWRRCLRDGGWWANDSGGTDAGRRRHARRRGAHSRWYAGALPSPRVRAAAALPYSRWPAFARRCFLAAARCRCFRAAASHYLAPALPPFTCFLPSFSADISSPSSKAALPILQRPFSALYLLACACLSSPLYLLCRIHLYHLPTPRYAYICSSPGDCGRT